MTTSEQMAVMAVGVVETIEADTDVVFTLRRVARAQMDGPRWTATVGRYSKRAVNGEGSIRQRTTSAEACAAVACSDDPRELVRVAFEHWDNIGWPEDKGPVSLLKRALELLSC